MSIGCRLKVSGNEPPATLLRADTSSPSGEVGEPSVGLLLGLRNTPMNVCESRVCQVHRRDVSTTDAMVTKEPITSLLDEILSDEFLATLTEDRVGNDLIYELIKGRFYASAQAKSSAGSLVDHVLKVLLHEYVPSGRTMTERAAAEYDAWGNALFRALTLSPTECEVHCLGLRHLLSFDAAKTSPTLWRLRDTLYRPVGWRRKEWQRELVNARKTVQLTDCRDIARGLIRARLAPSGFERYASHSLTEPLIAFCKQICNFDPTHLTDPLKAAVDRIASLALVEEGPVELRAGLPVLFEHMPEANVRLAYDNLISLPGDKNLRSLHPDRNWLPTPRNESDPRSFKLAQRLLDLSGRPPA